MFEVRRGGRRLRTVEGFGHAMTLALQMALEDSGQHYVRVYQGNECVFKAEPGCAIINYAGARKSRLISIDGKRVV